jgi:flagellar hook-length control protein FliK
VDIATVIATTNTTGLNAQSNAAAGANAPEDAMFGVLLQQLAQLATPADIANQPALQIDMANLQPGKNVGVVPNEAANDAAAPLPPQLSPTAPAPSDGAPPTADSLPLVQNVPPKDAKPAAKSDQAKAPDSDAQANPKTAPDANLVAALFQQIQPAAIQPQSSASNAPSPRETAAAVTPPVTPASVATPAPVGAAGQAKSGKNAAAASDKTESANLAQTGTNDSGAVPGDVPKVDPLKDDAKGNQESARSANPQDAAPAQNAQSAPSGQSALTPAPSVAVTAVQAQIQTANAASVNVNLQVAPQHRDAASTPAMDALGVAIAAKSAEGVKHFDIRLDPPELGRVQVHLSLDDSGKAQATLMVDKPQTLELLQRDAANLARSLTDAGVSLSNNGLNFSLRGQDRQDDGGGVVKGRSRALSVKAVMSTDAISNSGSIGSLAPDSVRLDIRV